MKIFVTGGCGFIGGKLCQALIREGFEVFSLMHEGDSSPHPLITLISWSEARDLKFDMCYHQAANNNTMDINLASMAESNVLMPSSLFESLRKNGCRKFVYASSTAVYGNSVGPYTELSAVDPLNAYAESKLAFEEFAEDFARETGLAVLGLRYCNVYGPGECHKGKRSSMIRQILIRMISGFSPQVFRDGEQKRDWVHVDDVIKANIACVGCERSGVVNIAGGRSFSFNELIEKVNKQIGGDIKAEYLECDFKERYQNETLCDISRAKEWMGWMPSITMDRGIEDYISFLRASLEFNGL